MRRLAAKTTLVMAALVLLCRPALADYSPYEEVFLLGQLRAVMARAPSTVQMKREHVVLVPFYDRRVSQYPVVLVNARFDFFNPGAALEVPVGFPEAAAKQHRCGEESGPGWPKRKNCCAIIRGRETSASCSTPWSAPVSSREAE